jgi:hypothetical protein
MESEKYEHVSFIIALYLPSYIGIITASLPHSQHELKQFFDFDMTLFYLEAQNLLPLIFAMLYGFCDFGWFSCCVKYEFMAS